MKQNRLIRSAHLLSSPFLLSNIVTLVTSKILNFLEPKENFYLGFDKVQSILFNQNISLFSIAISCFIANSTIDRLNRENYINIEPSLTNFLLRLGLISLIIVLQKIFYPFVDILVLFGAYQAEKYYKNDQSFSFFSNFLPNVFGEVHHCIETVRKMI